MGTALSIRSTRTLSRMARLRRIDARRLGQICAALEGKYSNPRHGNPSNALDDLIYIILSTRTRNTGYKKSFRSLKTAFPKWNGLTPTKRRRILKILTPCGLGRLKTRQIISIVATLKQRLGRATLAPLAKMTDSDAEAFLTSLPGVGPKIAKCVLMYALNRCVLPVDVHVHRIATRIGFKTKKRPDTSQQLIEDAVPPNLRYSFHVNAIALGREICLSRNPRCEVCPISKWCEYCRARRGRLK
jgi:endonuclease-3